MESTWKWTTTGYGFAGKTHEQIRDLCRAAGLSGIEGVPPLFEEQTETELEKIGADYRDAGLCIDTFHLPFSSEDDIASFYETVRRRAVDKALRWMHRAACVGATVGIQHPTINRSGVDVEGLDPFLRQIGRSLETLLPRAKALGFTVAVENMMPADGGRFASRPEHLERIAREFEHPALGFCLDTGHALVAGGPERAGGFFDAMAPRMVAFHLADNAGDRDSHLAPGHGLVDWNAFFRHAADIGYERTMCIETPPFRPGPDYSPDAWKSLVSETGALARNALESTP